MGPFPRNRVVPFLGNQAGPITGNPAFIEGILRYGTLYRCVGCNQPWYLCGDPEFMNCVPTHRLELLKRWNEQPVVLMRPDHLSQLEKIRRTPPDVYGNGVQFHETPCAVRTIGGEHSLGNCGDSPEFGSAPAVSKGSDCPS